MITIFGDSHVSILGFALEDHPNHDIKMLGAHGANWLDFDIQVVDEGLQVTAENVPSVPKLDVTLKPEGPHYFSSILHTPPYFRDAIWKTHCPWNIAANHRNLVPLSNSTLELWIDRAIARRMELLEMMVVTGFDISVVEPPKAVFRTPKLFKVDKDIIRAVDTFARSHICKRLEDIGVMVIHAPEETYENGFTTPEYSAARETDPHHGSKLFSQAVLNKIVEDSMEEVAWDQLAAVPL